MERAGKRLQKSFARLQMPITSLCAAGSLFNKSITRAVVVLATFLLAAPAAHAWWDLTWDARIQLTFNNSGQTENLIDFPVLVVLDPSNIDYGQLEPNGEDLRFVDADDATLLKHEIESWNPGGTSYVWVRVPQIDGLSSTDFIYLYYDKTGAPDVQDSAGVWSAGYLAVWHLDDNPSGAASVLDSTVNAKHGSGSASMNAGNVVGGQIGQATTFDGIADYIRVPSGAGDVLEINGENLTMESWVRRNGSTPGNVWMALVGRQLGTASAPDAYVQVLDLNDPSISTFASSAGNASSPSGAVPDLTWRYLAATKDASFVTHYVSGSQTGQTASGGPIVSDPNDVTIGAMENDASANPTEWYVGEIDEVRISNVTRSADWIAAQHLSMTQNFVTFSNLVSGTVFEDADFAGTASDYDGGVNDMALANVDVELYSSTDIYIASTTTDGSGNFSFTVADGTYKVRVRTATIGDSNTPPTGIFNAACGITDPTSGVACAVAEQTWANGAAAYGGQSATADDTATNNDAGPGDTWISVTVTGADVADINFGFAYNLIVNTNNAGQGSLDQFIVNANAIGSAAGTTANSSEFRVPATDPGFAAGVAVIAPTSALPLVTDAGTTIDGGTQTSNIGNTNPAVFGTGGTVGVDALPLSTVAGPEIEIRDAGGLAHGIRVQANNVTVRGVAMLGFGAADNEGAIRIDSGFTGALVEDNVLGSTATSFTDPGAALRNYSGVTSDGADNGTIRNNLIGFGHRGVFMVVGSSTWTVEGNEIVDHDLASTDGDGIALSDSTSITVRGNLITGSSSQGFVVTNSSLSNFVNNTVTGNGVGSTTAVAQSAGITMRSTANSTTIDRNIVHLNYGAGIQVNDGATGTTITRNSFADNGTILARDLSLPTDQIGVDLNVSGDNANFGTADFFSINNQLDSLQDFPILETAEIAGGNLTLTGWSKASATIEVFIAATDPHGFGEGETYIGTFVEGVLDADPGTSDYSGLINGLDQGADVNASRFSFTVPVPAGVVDSTQLTATATVGAETSEFSGLVTTTAGYAISGTVFEDADFVGTASDYDGGTNDLALPNVDVELYTNADAYITSTATDASGNFSFAGLANATYKVRVRSATLGDSNTPPSGTFNAACGITDPASGPGCVVAEQTWGNGAAAYGGQSATADDIATNDNAGPGDTWLSISVSGADVNTVNFGFAYNLITNTNDAGQGSLRQFMENADSIGNAGGTTANASEFRIPLSDPNYNAGLGAHTISLAGALPVISDDGTIVDGQTQTDNVGSTNAADFTHPFYGAAKSVGTGVDGIAGTGDETTLPAYPNPEIEINGNDMGSIFAMTASSGVVRRLALYNSTPGEAVLISAGTGNTVEDNYVGLRADGSDPGAGSRLQHGLEITGGSGIIRNNIVAYSEAGGSLIASTATVSGNEFLSNALLSAAGDALSTESSSGEAIAIRDNRIHDSSAYGIESWNAPGPFTIENNTVSDSGNGGGLEIGGIRIFGSNSTVRYNISTDAVGAGIVLAQTGGSNSQNLVSRNSTYANGGLGIDIEGSDFGSPDGDGVTPNNGAMNAGIPNNEMDYPVITVSTLSGSTLHVEGYVGTAATKIAAVHTVEIYKAADDGNNNGEIEAGDALSVPHGEGQTFIDACSSAVDGTFACDLTVPGAVSLSVGEDIVGIAYDAFGNTSEFSANAAVANEADLVTTKVLDPSTPGPFAEGDAVTYLLTVTNNGPAQATNVSATDTFPGELTLGVPVPSAPTNYDTGTGVWTIGTLNSGASATLQLPGTVNAGTAGDVVTNSVTAASGDQSDPTTAGDDLNETFTVLPFLSIDDVAQAETDSGTTTFTFTVSISQAVGYDITFDVDTADNTATVGDSDYVAITAGSGTITNGSTTTTIDVTVNGDANIEADETFFVNLSGVVGAAVSDAQGQGTINNDDGAAVSIATTTDANESGPVNGQFTVTQSTTSATDTVISYSIAGTATAGGTDYATLSGSVTVLAGDTTATIDVTGIVVDALVEGPETVIVTLTGTDNPGIPVAASPADTATVNILDADSANASIAATTDGSEAGPTDGQFTVTQSVTSITDTIVSYTVAGTATAGGTDYASLSGSVTVPAGSTTATIDVTGIVVDALVEGTETVIVTLTGTDNPGIAVAASPADSATVNILDNSAANVSIASTLDANETGPVDGQFTVTQSTTSASDTMVTYTVAGTATAGGTDYTTLSGSVTVPAGSTTATIDVTGIVADALIEGDETVVVTLTGTDNIAITVAASPADTATVTILDDAAAAVTIAATSNGAESGPVDGLFTLTQSATAINDTVISYVVAGTATSGSDYSALSGTVTIPGGATTATIVVPVIDDAVAEGIAETVDVTLNTITASDPGISIAASPLDVASITIADNDSDLVTSKTVSNAAPQEGDSITYTITVTNSTGVQATNVSLTDTLPAGVTYVSDDSGGAYDIASGLWSIGTVDTVAPNNVAMLNITAAVDAGASSLAQPITNTTTAAIGDQPDPDTSTDSLTAAITVDANADLVTTKTVDNASPVENSTIVYTISVLNNGAAQASNVNLVDVLPNGVTYVSDDSGGNYNPVTGAWTIGTIDDGALANLNITATVDAGAGTLAQPISNVSTAALGDQPDPDTTTDSLTADVTVNYTANLVTTKTIDVASPRAGDTIVYTLTATNNGPAPATNVSLTDSLPAGVSYVGDDSAGAYSNATGIWTIGDLANGAAATLNISATVDSGAAFLPQPITNTTTAASADQTDPDTTADDLSADIIVNLIDPNLVQLNKTAGRNRANAGEIVSYSIEIRNTGVNPIAAVRVSDSPARGFKYVPGTAQLDGVPIADPAGGFPLAFDIGTLPGLVDSDGNGVADPGEPGYAVLSYRMVAGSGVAPGIWTNTAIATATCETCFVSNIASADIEIIEDTLFDLGTIIGKVFYDGDGDGYQDSGEGGIEAAMVALDDGTYALTDQFGRYHFPAVKPGQRLLKINLNSLAGKATATKGKTRIVNVTPGLLAKANFGVIVETVDAAIGEDGQYGVGVDSEAIHPPVVINGSSVAPSLLVNGEPVPLASADVRLGSQKINDVVELDNGSLSKPIRFSTRISDGTSVKQWKLIVAGAGDEVVKTWKGKGAPPEAIEWDGVRKNGKLINSAAIYTYHLELDTSDGQAVSSSHRLFGVNRRNSISLNLAGGAFVSASHELTSKAKKLLSKTAEAIRAYPDELVVISGHTDSVGSDQSNMALAERRARSAFDYLRKVENLPEEQFVIQAFGESQPIADNDTAWGRELNRRVEISGDLNSVDRARNYDPYRQPAIVQINADDIELDETGAFRTKVDMEADWESMKVLLTTSQGRSVETVVKLPTLHVIAPQGRVAIPIDSDGAGPDIFDADSNTLLLHTELLGRTEPGNTVEFNGEALDVDDNGLFMAQLPLRTGENYYGLVARNPMGMLRIANLKLTLEKSSLEAPEFVVEPVPQLALQLPPPGIPMTHANLVIPGRTVPGNRVFINDRPIDVDADGQFTATVELQRGENPFVAKVVDQDGHSGEIEQTFEYNGEPMFFMALVDGKVSQLETSGNLAAAGKTKSKETVTEGRVAYYLKGHVLGKYLLTSAFDSGRQEMGEIFSDLTAQDNDRLLTNLDPDTLYPVYGDNSTLVYDAQTQSKFYLALESETVTALIGNYALNFTDTELAGYQRTLYGATATYQSEARDEDGNSKTKVQAFHAKIEQAHVRDELRATGGSLYYLSERNVIEGSEHISVIVRDQDTGLILRRTALQQGLDYSIDYVDGRLLTNRPISSFTADYSLIESDLLGGSAVYLQIDYETALDGFEQTASGARVRQGVGERLAVGATAVDEDQLGSQYSLKAADAEYKVGKNSRLIAEFATSEGNNSIVNVSEDGGLSYQAVPQAADSNGDAYKIAAEIDAGEWFGYEDRVLLNTYFKRLDPGFSANSVTSEQGSEKSGFAANWKISEGTSLLGRHEKQLNLLDGSENTLSTMQWNLLRDQWGLAAEVEDRQGFAGDATFAALRMNYRWTQALSTSLLHQATLAGIDNDQSTVGVAYRATERLTLDASATHGTKGDSAQIGAQLDWRGNRFYVAQQLSDLEASGFSNNRLVGMEAPFGSDGAVYSEYHWNRLPDGRQRQAMLGARQRFHASDVFRIEISGEHSAENATNNNTGERYALSIGAIYDNDNGVTFSTRNEYRKDSRSIASEQFLSTSNMRFALGDDFSMIGKYRFSKSESSEQLDRNIDFTEASFGLAYRPVAHDRLNLLTRITRLTNTPTEFQLQSPTSGTTSDIFAVDWSYQVTRGIEWVGKQAMRWTESDDDPLELRSLTSLSIQRLNWSMPKKLLLGTEYRIMRQDIADDQRQGFVTELMWEGLDPVILGIGYNFSDVSDNEYVDYDFSTKGPFFRLQGKF